RLSLRWTPIPSAVLRLVTHAPIKWRAAVLTALMVTALVLLYVSRSPSPVAAPFPDAALTGATLDQLLTYPVPAHLNAALVAQRDSALAARERAGCPGWRPSTPSRSAWPPGWLPPPPSHPRRARRSPCCCRISSARCRVSASGTCRC